MRAHLGHRLHLARSVLLLGVMAVLARAEPIAVAGSTTGAYDTGTLSTSAVLNGLTFTGTSFASAPGTVPETQTLTFGSFYLAPGRSINYGGHSFAVNVVFTVPAGTGAQTVGATLEGRINNGGNIPGGQMPTVNFGAPVTVNFTGGSFSLQLNDVAFSATGTTQLLRGTITDGVLAAASPEPTSLLLLGTAVAGLGFVCRKRLGRM